MYWLSSGWIRPLKSMCQRVCRFRKGRKKYVKKGSFKKIREQLRIKTCAELWGMVERHSRFRSLPGRLRADSYCLWCIPFSAFNEEIGQRQRQWKRRWNFETFSPLHQVTQLLESKEVRWELKRGDRVRVQREQNVSPCRSLSPVNSKFVISRRSCCKDGREMYKKACRVVFFCLFPLPSPS